MRIASFVAMRWMIAIFLAVTFVIWDVTRNDSQFVTMLGSLFLDLLQLVGVR